MTFDPNAAAPKDSGIFGLPYVPDEAGVLLVPVPWDATTSYRPGTAKGPDAILRASRQIDLFDVELGKPYEAKIAMLPIDPEIAGMNAEARAAAEPILEAGGNLKGRPELVPALDLVNALGARLNEWVYDRVRRGLERGQLVGVVGGDHASPFGAIQAVAEAHAKDGLTDGKGVGILHLDAHADLRHAYEGFEWSHASIMENVMRKLPGISKLVQVGIRDLCAEEHERIQESGGRIRAFYDTDLARMRMRGAILDGLSAAVDALPSAVYLSFDIDGLDPSFCPHTGTPVPGGLSFHEACALVRLVHDSGRRIVGFDLNEVAPGHDGDEWDANVGARLLYKMIGWAVASQKAPKADEVRH